MSLQDCKTCTQHFRIFKPCLSQKRCHEFGISYSSIKHVFLLSDKIHPLFINLVKDKSHPFCYQWTGEKKNHGINPISQCNSVLTKRKFLLSSMLAQIVNLASLKTPTLSCNTRMGCRLVLYSVLWVANYQRLKTINVGDNIYESHEPWNFFVEINFFRQNFWYRNGSRSKHH